MEQRGFFGLSEHLEKLSEHGDPLEVLEAAVDFEYFRGWLVEGLLHEALGLLHQLIGTGGGRQCRPLITRPIAKMTEDSEDTGDSTGKMAETLTILLSPVQR